FGNPAASRNRDSGFAAEQFGEVGRSESFDIFLADDSAAGGFDVLLALEDQADVADIGGNWRLGFLRKCSRGKCQCRDAAEGDRSKSHSLSQSHSSYLAWGRKTREGTATRLHGLAVNSMPPEVED